jgi:hypothetical protein
MLELLSLADRCKYGMVRTPSKWSERGSGIGTVYFVMRTSLESWFPNVLGDFIARCQEKADSWTDLLGSAHNSLNVRIASQFPKCADRLTLTTVRAQ